MNKLKNKVAIITGGAGEIGKATAEKFLSHGATVIIWDTNTDKSLPFDCYNVNVVDYEMLTAAAKKVYNEHKRIDILINNAGITRDATLEKMTPDEWQQVIDVNLKGVFNCTKAISKYMVANSYGRIINTSSIVGIYGNYGQTNYVASKAGVIGMTKVWARELGKKGITVNAVAPGFIATEMVKTIPKKIIDAVTDKTPLKRLGTPEDVANAYLFLASDEASFINGTVLNVDGGLVI